MFKKLDFINALRGYAILGVIIVHASQFIVLPKAFLTITDRGQMGVQLFFIASAFTLFYSLENRKAEIHYNTNFYIRRFFRIAPLYYIAIFAYYLFIDKLFIGDFTSANNIQNLIFHIFFINGFNKVYMNTLLPGSWSIAVEMMFYLFVPILFKYIKNLKNAIILFLCTSSASIALNIIYFSKEDWYHYFWFINQMPVFSLGIVLYYMYKQLNLNKMKWVSWSFIIPLLFLGMIALSFYSSRLWYCIHILYAILFVAFSIALASYKGNIFTNKYLSYLGEISFSCYLVHFGVLWSLYRVLRNFYSFTASNSIVAVFEFVILLFATIAITVFISHITYKYIEKPGIELGKRVIKYIEQNKAATRKLEHKKTSI